jgi:NAD(P)-dependent dehydrogenase (short-subunit alcohol dehydrogenase family)
MLGRVSLTLAVIVAGASFNHQQREARMAASLRAARLSLGSIGTGKTAVVTGATSGIGRACAKLLAESGFSVIAIGRSASRGAEVLNEMTAASDGQRKHEFISCDAFSLREISKAAASIRSAHPVIDVLVLSQGMATIQGFTPTAEGNDEKLTLHYWGRMAFISELLPSLRVAPMPRVVSVLSGGMHSAYLSYEVDPELKETYSIKNAADAAGFYNDLGLDALAIQQGNENIVFVHAAPGFVKTSWGTEMPWFLRGPIRALQVWGMRTQSDDLFPLHYASTSIMLVVVACSDASSTRE